MSAPTQSLKLLVVSLLISVLLAAAKLAAAVLTGSSVMYAAAVQALADSLGQALLMAGSKAIKPAPLPDFPVGWGHAGYFWAQIAILPLYCLSAFLAIDETVHKLTEPQEIEGYWLALAVLALSLLMHGFAGWQRWQRLRRTDVRAGASELISLRLLLLQHLAACLASAIGLAALLLSLLLEQPLLDALGSAAMGIMMLLLAALAGRQLVGQLCGPAPDMGLRHAMAAFLQADPAVRQIRQLWITEQGRQLRVCARLDLTSEDAEAVLQQRAELETRFRGQFPQVDWLALCPEYTPPPETPHA
ncbi:cation transporter [Chitinimonas sp.]|uniref:cation transporter n=1 Tax=Chitinimonas sp. TaxID=1934313 RepID=UPI0035B31C21